MRKKQNYFRDKWSPNQKHQDDAMVRALDPIVEGTLQSKSEWNQKTSLILHEWNMIDTQNVSGKRTLMRLKSALLPFALKCKPSIKYSALLKSRPPRLSKASIIDTPSLNSAPTSRTALAYCSVIEFSWFSATFYSMCKRISLKNTTWHHMWTLFFQDTQQPL